MAIGIFKFDKRSFEIVLECSQHKFYFQSLASTIGNNMGILHKECKEGSAPIESQPLVSHKFSNSYILAHLSEPILLA